MLSSPGKEKRRRRRFFHRSKIRYTSRWPNKTKGRAIQWRSVLLAFLAVLTLAVIVYAGSNLLRAFRAYQSSQREYESYRWDVASLEAQQARLHAQYTLEENQPKMPAVTTAPVLWTPAPATTVFLDYNYRLICLQDKNKDLIGWVNIPGTVIDYPIVQTGNNSYYMNHTFAKKKNPSGAIFMDYRGDETFGDHVSIIYGHHMKDGSMFSALRQYKNKQFLQAHQQVQIETLTKTHQYQVFAAFFCDKNDDFLYYNQSKEGIRQELITYLMRKSGHLIGQINWPGEKEHILILMTCDYGNTQGDFWAVAAYRSAD